MPAAVDEIGIFADGFAAGITGDSLKGGVDVKNYAAQIRDHDGLGGLVQSGAQPEALFLGLAAFGDVAGNARQPDDPVLVVQHRVATIVNPADQAVGPDNPVFHTHGTLVGGQFRKRRPHTLPFFTDHRFHPLFRLGVKTIRGAAPDLFVGRTHIMHHL